MSVLPNELFRTASFRIALFYAALFLLSVSVIFVIIYLATAGYTARQLSTAVEEDLSALQTEYQLGGLQNVVSEIVSRTDAAQGHGTYYLLQTPGGRLLAGNAGPLPARTGWTNFLSGRNSASGTADRIMAKAVFLPDGSYLLVGRDAARLDDLESRIVEAFLWGSAATLVLAGIGAVLMSMVSLRRVEAISRATEEIVGGNLSRRIPTAGTHDEFDRLAEQVNRMLDRIEALMTGLKQVSNDIAHDLKTPLTRLRHGLELARHQAGNVAAYEAAVDRAIAECDLTLRTFDALLRIAQIEAGTRRSGFQNVDLHVVVDTILDAYQPVAEESGHPLSATAAENSVVRGDRELLTQMLANLVENALKHTPAGTSIAVSVAAAGDRWQLGVADRGPGVPAAECPRLFQRFYRREVSRTTPGSGLGLSLVAAVAQLHDAPIEVTDNAPGLKVTVSFARAG